MRANRINWSFDDLNYADVAELVDAHASGACILTDVEVRVLSSAPRKAPLAPRGEANKNRKNLTEIFFYIMSATIKHSIARQTLTAFVIACTCAVFFFITDTREFTECTVTCITKHYDQAVSIVFALALGGVVFVSSFLALFIIQKKNAKRRSAKN